MPSGDGIFKNLPGDFFWVSKAVAMSGVLPQPLSVGLSLIWSPEGLVLVIQGQGLLAEVPEGPLQSWRRRLWGRTGRHWGAESWLRPSPAV